MNAAGIPLHCCPAVPRDSLTAVRVAQVDASKALLFFNDLGILEHGDAAALGEFALNGDVLAAVFGQLIVDRLVFTNDQIGLVCTYNTHRTTTSDALGAT